MTVKYKNPPLVEIVCEFRFDLDNPNDATLPGLFYNSVKKEFPNRKQKTMPDISGLEPGKQEQRIMLMPVTQFLKKDESRLLQIGQNMLTINNLKNYPHWEKFKPIILEIYSRYRSAIKPKGLKKIGLRCINKIILDTTTPNLSDYFNYYPSFPSEKKEPLSGFVIHVEKELQEGRDRIIVKNMSVFPDKKNQSAFILDIDYFLFRKGDIRLSDIEGWLENAHIEINKVFEASITDKLRKIFDK